MPRRDVVAVVRAFVWLLALAGVLCKAGALLVDPPEPVRTLYLPIIAIDLGNTNSCVAGYESGETKTMFHHCIPSWVAFADDGAVLVGEDAMNYAAVNPGAVVSSFKRLLSERRAITTYETEFAQSVKENRPYKFVDKYVHFAAEVKTNKDGVAFVRHVDIEQLTAAVLAKLKETAEVYLGGRRVYGAILNLPLHSTDGSRSAAVSAGMIAGLGC